MRRLSATTLVIALLAGAAACRGAAPSAESPPEDARDAGLDAALREDAGAPARDHGAPSSIYPAFPPDAPQLMKQSGGDVLASPVLVTVTWPGGPSADTVEAFAERIGASAYWNQITSEYGVGPARSSAVEHVRMATPLPSSITSEQIAALIAEHVVGSAANSDGGAGAGAAWPAPTDQTVYTLFIPSSTKVFEPGAAVDVCAQNGGGYHDTTTAGGKEIVYAVVLECAAGDIAATTLVASHEWAEAATDPRPRTAPAFQGLDDRHLALDAYLGFQDEVGDLCAAEADAQLDASASLPFATQRQWSNASARLGHCPCVPAPSGPYATAVVLDPLPDRIPVFLAPGDPSGPAGAGIVLGPGEARVLPLGFATDAPSAPFAVSAEEWTFTPENGPLPATGKARTLDLSLDKRDGQNGEKTFLTITRHAYGESGLRIVVLRSTLNGVVRTTAVLVGGTRS